MMRPMIWMEQDPGFPQLRPDFKKTLLSSLIVLVVVTCNFLVVVDKVTLLCACHVCWMLANIGPCFPHSWYIYIHISW